MLPAFRVLADGNGMGTIVPDIHVRYRAVGPLLRILADGFRIAAVAPSANAVHLAIRSHFRIDIFKDGACGPSRSKREKSHHERDECGNAALH